jgi:hypothetical protein
LFWLAAVQCFDWRRLLQASIPFYVKVKQDRTYSWFIDPIQFFYPLLRRKIGCLLKDDKFLCPNFI